MSELRVPTNALAAEVLCADGRTFVGRIFLPILSSHHGGVMRAEEWMNESKDFFPFLPDDEKASVLLNKREIVVMSVRAEADEAPPEEIDVPKRFIAVECGDRRLEGIVLIDMPWNRSRVLDYLNDEREFLTLRDGERHHLVQKRRVTRVIESPEEK